MEGLIDVGDTADDADDFLDDISDSGYRVYQAQGMVMIQLGITAQEALLRLRAHAFAQDQRLSAVAEDVVARRLTFGPDDSEGRTRT